MGDIEILKVEGPRISLTHDDEMPASPVMEKLPKRNHLAEDEEAEKAGSSENAGEGENDDNDTEFSFEFSSSVILDLPFEHKMLSAEELFFNGKLRPLSTEGSDTRRQGRQDFHLYEDKGHLSNIVVEDCDAVPRRNSDARSEASWCGGTDHEFPINLPLVRTSLTESLILAKQHLKSLQESPRCLSMTIEGSRGHPRRSCVSLNSSRCSSPTRPRKSGTFSQPPTTPTSPKAPSSIQKTSKFLHFFKLKKHLHGSKEALLISSDNPIMTSGSRLARTLWPFSRSNSAGESKRSHGVATLLPRRSNSSGESKTASASLLPNNAINKHSDEAIKSAHTIENLIASSRRQQANQTLTDKEGLLPLRISTTTKNSSGFMLSNCGTNSEALSQMGCGGRASFARTSYTPTLPTPASQTFEDATQLLSAGGQGDNSTHTDSGSSCISKEAKANSASPGRQVRHVSASNPVRGITRGSPTRQWSNPNMGSTTRNRQRQGPMPRGLNIRPKDALSRETTSVRVAPVLNVPACMTPSSKSRLFNIGNLFARREKIARGYTTLVACE